jgi:hypothetical protein
MKLIAVMTFVQAMSVALGAASGVLILVAIVGWIFSLFAALSYALIIRRGVAPRVELGKGRLKIWFEGLRSEGRDRRRRSKGTT